MAKQNKIHHTIPAAYLRGFARSRENPRLEVLDLESGLWRANQNPAKICRENRFYAVDSPGIPPNSVETDFLGRIEREAMPLVRRINRESIDFCRFGGPRPRLNQEDRELLAGFAAMMFVRSAQTRERARFSAEVGLTGFSKEVLADRESFEKTLASAKADGVVMGDFSFEDAQSFAAGSDLILTLDQTFEVGMMLKAWAEVFPSFCARRLSFLVAGGSAGPLITSDCPVSPYLRGSKAAAAVHEFYAINIMSDEFGVHLPLTRLLALRYDENAPSEIRPLSAREVAMINYATAIPEAGLVIAPSRDFRWLRGDQIVDPGGLHEEFKRTRSDMMSAGEGKGLDLKEKLLKLYRDSRG